MIRRFAIAMFLLSAPLFCGAETVSVTNLAGRAISGEFGGVTNGAFYLAGHAYPLSALPVSEQVRLRTLAGQDVRSAKEKTIDRDLAYELNRIRAREGEGEITAEQAAALRVDAYATAEFRRRALAPKVMVATPPSVSTNATASAVSE